MRGGRSESLLATLDRGRLSCLRSTDSIKRFRSRDLEIDRIKRFLASSATRGIRSTLVWPFVRGEWWAATSSQLRGWTSGSTPTPPHNALIEVLRLLSDRSSEGGGVRLTRRRLPPPPKISLVRVRQHKQNQPQSDHAPNPIHKTGKPSRQPTPCVSTCSPSWAPWSLPKPTSSPSPPRCRPPTSS